MKVKYILIIVIVGIFFSCNNNNNPNKNANVQPSNPNKAVNNTPPAFSGDSAYSFVKTQVDFGPRIPGSAAHAKCADFIINKLKAYGLEPTVQHGMVSTFDKKSFNLDNILASYKPESKPRILLMTHWDTRPFADADSVDKDKPFDGANDGGSGVAVLLELARQLGIQKPNCGVDFFFSDLEDYGRNNDDDTWCLGTQYWIKNPPKPNYNPDFGILLDMVGAKNAVFPMEGTGMHFASVFVQKVWDIAGQIGYAEYFTQDKTAGTIDDHYFVNRDANIPCIDIVHYEIQHKDYPYFHHKHSDNMSIIDKNTLMMVGQVVLAVIISENGS